MRAFVGLPFRAPESVLGLLEELRATGADFKLVEPENLHVTLKFLGEIPEAQADPILQRLRSAGFPTQYRLALRDVGAFPDWRRLNILWIGLTDPEGHVARSFALSERLFAELGFPSEDRPFSPHVTIGRKRGEAGRDAAKRVLEARRGESFGEVEIGGPVLLKSLLTPQGARYERLGGVT